MDAAPRLHKLKRLEIVIEAVKLEKVLGIIDEAGATGYTIVSPVKGRGHRGYRQGGGLTDLFKNALIVTVVDESIAVKILSQVDRLIQNFAGIAIVTDASVLLPDYNRDQPK